MVSHPNRGAAAQASIEFCEELFSRVYGRANVRVGGALAGFDQDRNEVFVKYPDQKTIWMPAGAFLKNLSTAEVAALQNMGEWDGGNELFLSETTVNAIEVATRRHRGTKVFASRHDRDRDYFAGAAAFLERVEDGRVVRSPAD